MKKLKSKKIPKKVRDAGSKLSTSKSEREKSEAGKTLKKYQDTINN